MRCASCGGVVQVVKGSSDSDHEADYNENCDHMQAAFQAVQACSGPEAAGATAAAPLKASAHGYSKARGPKLWDQGRADIACPGATLTDDGPRLQLAPNEGAWIPVQLTNGDSLSE